MCVCVYVCVCTCVCVCINVCVDGCTCVCEREHYVTTLQNTRIITKQATNTVHTSVAIHLHSVNLAYIYIQILQRIEYYIAFLQLVSC